MYICPVCGYDRLRHPPDDYIICPSCGTEFGYTDFNRSHAELRRAWVANGARWYSSALLPPPNWDGVRQLQRAGKWPVRISVGASFSIQGSVSPETTLVGQTEGSLELSYNPIERNGVKIKVEINPAA